MKLPIIRHLQKHHSKEMLQNTADVLESFTEHRSVKEAEMDVVGELLTNLYGAMEVHELMERESLTQMEAANAFAQKVLGSIDR